MNTFKTGVAYISGKAYGPDTKNYMTIDSRSAKYAVVHEVGSEPKRCKIHTDSNGEFIIVDAITVYRADRFIA